MTMKRLLAVAAVGSFGVVGTGSVAFAGEVTGNGKATPAGERARSECAFSGLEDGETLIFVDGVPVVVPTEDSGPGWVQTPAGETSPGVTYPPGIAGQACRGNAGG